MLKSLVKIILFMAAVAALALGAVYLMDSTGGIRIEAMGRERTFGPLASVIGLGILVLGVWVLLKVLSLLIATWHFLNGDETAISRYFDRNRERKGYDALAQGMMALASGEGAVAMNKAEKARKYLDKPELTNLLTLSQNDRKRRNTVCRCTWDPQAKIGGWRYGHSDEAGRKGICP